MVSIQQFDGKRARGIVWVCDIAHSSKNLNRNDTAGPTEEFLQRFLYVSLIAVEASQGEFIKWTGDGFMAWYEVPLDRHVGDIVSRVFHAAYQLTLYVNLTQLGVSSPVKFHIRHGVTYEKDALVIDLKHSGTMASRDVLGRNVVLAFRISSLSGKFPNIVTQQELAEASSLVQGERHFPFEKIRFSKNELLRYFKGETWGVKNLYVSTDKQPKRRRTVRSLLNQAQKALKQYQTGTERLDTVTGKMALEMLNGPEWCQVVALEIAKYVREELAPALESVVNVLSKSTAAAASGSTTRASK